MDFKADLQTSYLTLIRQRETVYSHPGLRAAHLLKKAQEESESLLMPICCASKRQGSQPRELTPRLIASQAEKSGVFIDQRTGLLNFPSGARWLNGEEYAFLIRHYKAYCMAYKDSMSVTDFSHPECVYE